MWKGKYIPEACVEMGKNGAIPEPTQSQYDCPLKPITPEYAVVTSIPVLRVLLHLTRYALSRNQRVETNL